VVYNSKLGEVGEFIVFPLGSGVISIVGGGETFRASRHRTALCPYLCVAMGASMCGCGRDFVGHPVVWQQTLRRLTKVKAGPCLILQARASVPGGYPDLIKVPVM